MDSNKEGVGKRGTRSGELSISGYLNRGTKIWQNDILRTSMREGKSGCTASHNERSDYESVCQRHVTSNARSHLDRNNNC